MNENLFATKVYENITTFRLEQNKPNQTQYKPNFHPKNQHILSDVKSEINNIAVPNNVILAFKPNSAGGLEGLLTAKLFQVVKAKSFGSDKASFNVGMDFAGRINRDSTLLYRPGAQLI